MEQSSVVWKVCSLVELMGCLMAAQKEEMKVDCSVHTKAENLALMMDTN